MSIATDLFTSGVPIIEKVIRTLVVYAFLIVGLRVAGKRELSQLNPFDVIVLLLLSNTVQNAIIGNDDSLMGGLVGALTLLLANWVVVRVLYRTGELDKLEGGPELLIRGGRIQHKRLAREQITVAELEAAARRQGIPSLASVESCRLETGGALSFVSRRPTEDERRYDEIMDELRALRRLVERGAGA
jgi:uncharacterized membrane protein YcaP (DUF421 family)